MAQYYSASTGGFYLDSIHGDAIPADALEIPADDHVALLAGQSTGKRIVAAADGRPILVDPPRPPIAELAAQAEAEVRHQSAAARDAWRTPGKDAVYQRKLDEAAAWHAAGEPADLAPYPHLAAEVGITAPTAGDLATLWEMMAAAWVQASAQIEATEQGALKAIRVALDADDAEAIDAAVAGLSWPVPPA